MTVKATFFTEDGGGVTTTRTIPAGGRTNIWTAEPALNALANRRFAAAIESTSGGTFVAERAMYAFSDFRTGHVNMGTPWPGVIAAPAHPPATVTVTGITPAQVRLSGGEPITISGTGFSDRLGSHAGRHSDDRDVCDQHDDHGDHAGTHRHDRSSARWDRAASALTASGFTTVAGTIQRVFRVLAIGDSFTEGQLVERIPIPPSLRGSPPRRRPAIRRRTRLPIRPTLRHSKACSAPTRSTEPQPTWTTPGSRGNARRL